MTNQLFSIADLTRELGLPDHEQNAVYAWTGEDADLHEKVFTRAWMDEMIHVWKHTNDEGVYVAPDGGQ